MPAARAPTPGWSVAARIDFISASSRGLEQDSRRDDRIHRRSCKRYFPAGGSFQRPVSAGRTLSHRAAALATASVLAVVAHVLRMDMLTIQVSIGTSAIASVSAVVAVVTSRVCSVCCPPLRVHQPRPAATTVFHAAYALAIGCISRGRRANLSSSGNTN